MERLRALRVSRAETQKMLADMLGVDRTTYVKYEAGSSEPNFETIQKLADYFDVTVDYLLGRTDDSERQNSIMDQTDASILGKARFALLTETEGMTDDAIADVLNYAKFKKQQKKSSAQD